MANRAPVAVAAGLVDFEGVVASAVCRVAASAVCRVVASAVCGVVLADPVYGFAVGSVRCIQRGPFNSNETKVVYRTEKSESTKSRLTGKIPVCATPLVSSALTTNRCPIVWYILLREQHNDLISAGVREGDTAISCCSMRLSCFSTREAVDVICIEGAR